MTQTIRIHATAQIETLGGIAAEAPKPFRGLLSDTIEISFFHLSPNGAEYHSVFSGHSARARTSERGDIYIDVEKVHGMASLRALLFHEISHAMQFMLRRPLRFAAWTTWLGDLGFWDDRARALLQVITDKSGLKQVIPEDPVRYSAAARRLMNFFADADVHAFLLDEGVIDLSAYGEALADHVADLRISTRRAGSRALPDLWLEYQRVSPRPVRIAAQAWPVFADWLTIVAGRWARAGTLVGRSDAAAILGASGRNRNGLDGPGEAAVASNVGHCALAVRCSTGRGGRRVVDDRSSRRAVIASDRRRSLSWLCSGRLAGMDPPGALDGRDEPTSS